MRPFIIAVAAGLTALAFAAAADERPKNLRICIQFIEVAHADLTGLLAGPDTTGQALHDKALALTKDGTAGLLETCVVMTRSCRKATVESIREVIYPSEYEPPQLPVTVTAGSVPPVSPPPPLRKQLVRPDLGAAWDTRNVGTTLEIEPSLAEDGRMIDLRFVPEIIQLVRLDTFMEYVDQWGDCSIRMPVFETSRLNTSVTLLAGQFEMVGVITPKPNTPGPATTRKLLVFARGDIVPVPSQP